MLLEIIIILFKMQGQSGIIGEIYTFEPLGFCDVCCGEQKEGTCCFCFHCHAAGCFEQNRKICQVKEQAQKANETQENLVQRLSKISDYTTYTNRYLQCLFCLGFPCFSSSYFTVAASGVNVASENPCISMPCCLEYPVSRGGKPLGKLVWHHPIFPCMENYFDVLDTNGTTLYKVWAPQCCDSTWIIKNSQEAEVGKIVNPFSPFPCCKTIDVQLPQGISDDQKLLLLSIVPRFY